MRLTIASHNNSLKNKKLKTAVYPLLEKLTPSCKMGLSVTII
jgi:hypothetical protein